MPKGKLHAGARVQLSDYGRERRHNLARTKLYRLGTITREPKFRDAHGISAAVLWDGNLTADVYNLRELELADGRHEQGRVGGVEEAARK